MIDDLSLISLFKLVASMFLKLACISIYYHTVYYTLWIFLVVLMMVICSNLLLQIVGPVIMKFNFVFIINAKCSF